MNKEVFLEQLAETLEVDRDDLNEELVLNEDNWDSMAVLAAIAIIDEQFGVTVSAKKLTECTSVKALWNLVQSSSA